MTVPLPELRINTDRLLSSLMQLAEVGATGGGGCNRQALTDGDRVARDLFVDWAGEIGCKIDVDEVGNLFAMRAGKDPTLAPVLIGSHLDTQPTGGRYDGVYGVIAGLEVLRTLHQHGLATQRTIEAVSWTNEEGCRFVPAMLGSGVVAGAYALDFAYSRSDREGRLFVDELDRIGYRGTAPARARALHAAFELHIEQGPILEATSTTIGVVSGIQGAVWLDVVLDGLACHAGPTPMEMRRDPWRAACPIIEGAFELARAQAPWARATVGNLSVRPASRNTVPEQLVIAVDLRHPDREVLQQMIGTFRDLVGEHSSRYDIRWSIESVFEMPPTQFDARLVDLVETVATRLGHSNRRMVSGAGHDSLHVASYAPTAMIFVPCAGGLSHNEAESAAVADLEAGANVLLHAALIASNE